uniref:PilZ domain-containing protein n=1 Tax=uncultured Altererythrobacter sp. TaxID=500840 RepID=UPI00262A4B0D|nr:PilZ domain-containing protein [uncultured Altererythrobacter sp.]
MAELTQRRADTRVDGVQHAQLRLGREPMPHPIKVRNLSRNGMMGEGSFSLRSGTRLTINLPKQGEVAGTVVWVQEPRFGVAFDDEVDPTFA